MNVYDFDKTIYDGDSTVDFYRYCLCRYPGLICCVPKQMWAFLRYRMGKLDTTEFKERFFCFLPNLPSPEILADEFWKRRKGKIKAWYLAQKRSDDVIVSASPAFLLRPICKQLEISPPIATQVDPDSGKIEGINCKGEEKVRRFSGIYRLADIEAFYSDSLSDVFLARRAKNAFLVKKNSIQTWRL